MEWLEKMNEAINYIENNINEKVDFEEVAKIACCSLSRFQRMFSFATDITIAEYIRCRRMSMAAEDLLNSGIKVIELSQKYCYESPEAFTRAFQAFHGVPPTTVRKLGLCKDYPRISFEIRINGGHFNMGNKPIVRIEDHSNEKVVSFFADGKAPEDRSGNLMRDWAVKNIHDYTARRCYGYAPKGHHPAGEEHKPDEEEGTHEYVMNLFLIGNEGENDKFMGADVFDAPKGLFIISDVALNEFRADGSIDIGTSLQKSGQIMYECLQNLDGYELDMPARGYVEEQVLSNEWWKKKCADENGIIGMKLWLPIKKV